MSKETLVGVAWAIGILAAMGGIFWYEAATFEMNDYDVAFSESESIVDSDVGDLNAGQNAEHTLAIPAEYLTNLTQIRVELTWSDDIGDPDTFTLAWGNASDSDDTVVMLSKSVLSIPENRAIEALDEKDARTQLAGEVADISSEVTVTVTLDSAPGDSPGGVLEVTPDGSNDYTLTLIVTQYEAIITES